jgi:hypothetical protein
LGRAGLEGQRRGLKEGAGREWTVSSTYRYQVTQAVPRVVDLLWQREIGA